MTWISPPETTEVLGTFRVFSDHEIEVLIGFPQGSPPLYRVVWIKSKRCGMVAEMDLSKNPTMSVNEWASLIFPVMRERFLDEVEKYMAEAEEREDASGKTGED